MDIDLIASQAEYIPLLGLNNPDMDWDYHLDTDDNADTGLF